MNIPCKRPKVVIFGGVGNSARCDVAGCGWTYGPGVKTDVAEQAKWHRQAHRDAVPVVGASKIGRRYIDVCECGWITPQGVNTATDRKASLDCHLATKHGLVA